METNTPETDDFFDLFSDATNDEPVPGGVSVEFERVVLQCGDAVKRHYGNIGLRRLSETADKLVSKHGHEPEIVAAALDGLAATSAGILPPDQAANEWRAAQLAERKARAALTASLLWARSNRVSISNLSTVTGLSRKTVSADVNT